MPDPKLPDWARRYLPILVTILIAVFGGTGLALYVDDDDPGTPPIKIIDFRANETVGTQVTLPAVGGAPEQTVAVDDDQKQSSAQKADAVDDHTPDLHEDTKDETPPGISEKTLEAGREKTADIADEALGVPVEPAGAQAYSCPAAPVVNQSSLNGRRVGVALHFTVSNPGSLLAIRRLFNTSSFGASSNYGFELYSLKCQQWVPEGRKAWAQGAANSAYVSIEIISNDRSRASWLATPALQRGVLAALVRDIARRHGAPLKLVDPSGCNFTPGITDHNRLECGNTHWDVGGNFPWDVFMAQVRRGAPATNPAAVLAPPERKAALRRCYHRTRHIRATSAAVRNRELGYARRWIATIGRQRAVLRGLGLTDKHHRKARHRVLGGYATGRSC